MQQNYDSNITPQCLFIEGRCVSLGGDVGRGGGSLGMGGREGGGEGGKEWFPWEPQMTRRPALRGIRAPSPAITTKVLLVLSTLVKPAV